MHQIGETMTDDLAVVHAPLQFSTDEVEAPRRQPDLQRYEVTGVLSKTFDSGATCLQVGLRSQDEGFDTRLDIWLPGEFVADVRVSPKTLSTGTPTVDPATGRTFNKGNTQGKYAKSIHNSDNTALLDILSIEAAKGGHDLTHTPSTFPELVAYLNENLSATPILATRQENDNGFMEVRNIYPQSELSNAKFVTRMAKRYRIPANE